MADVLVLPLERPHARHEAPLVAGNKTPADVTREIAAALERKPGAYWWTGFALAFAALTGGVVAVAYQIATGIGTWGLNRSVGWAFDITNFVFWIGIGHAGTLISAILFLLRQHWRTSVNRAAEAMTLFAVICAALFPVIHMGRPWLAFWVLPYPNERGPLWINFRSPLIWDFFAIGTYFTISALFWYVGLLPDLATIRDRAAANGHRARLLGWFSLGWNGSYRTWHRYRVVYLLLAGLATPLVVSVHTVVSWDFATTMVPGWHSTIFPPYFVAGAIFSGLAMVLTLMLVARKTMRLEDYITVRHVEAMCKLVIATSGMVGLAYATELFVALYSGNRYEQFALVNRALGPLAWGFWIMVGCNVVVPQLLWFGRVRRSMLAVFIISIVINVGMWFERFIIIVGPLRRDFLPSSWAPYTPTLVEVATLVGSFGLFFTCFLLFCRFVPVIAMAEIKTVLQPHPAKRGRESFSVGIDAKKDSRPLFVSVFEREEDVVGATAAARAQGLQVADVYTPYEVHGLDRAMGLSPSRLPWVCFLLGLAGAVLMLLFEYWTMAVDWPINVGGKPWNSLPAFVPVTFEVMVLFAGVGTVAAFFVAAGLRPGRRPSVPDPRVTDDRFALVIVEDDERFDRAPAEALLAPFHPVKTGVVPGFSRAEHEADR